MFGLTLWLGWWSSLCSNVHIYIYTYIHIYIYVHIFSNQIPVKLNKTHYMITQWDVYVYVAGTFGVYFVPFSDTGQYTWLVGILKDALHHLQLHSMFSMRKVVQMTLCRLCRVSSKKWFFVIASSVIDKSIGDRLGAKFACFFYPRSITVNQSHLCVL